MENVIIILVIVVIATAGIRSTVRHFKGQGGCCGGELTISYAEKVDDEFIVSRIEKAGYTVVEIFSFLP